MITRRLPAIVFDMDGVLADTERLKYRAHRTAVEVAGGSLDPDGYRQEMGKAHVGVIRAFLSASGLDTSDAAVERYEERFQRAYRELLADDLRPMPGARKVLAACRDQARSLALVTSSERWMAEIVLGEILEGIVDGIPGWTVDGISHSVVDGMPNTFEDRRMEGIPSDFGAREVFEAVVTADDVEKEKPDPEPYLRAREALGIGRNPGGRDGGESGDERGAESGDEHGADGRGEGGNEAGGGAVDRPIVAVEDTSAGVASASAAGLPVIAVRHDFNRHHVFERATAILESLDPPKRFLELVDEVAYEGALP